MLLLCYYIWLDNCVQLSDERNGSGSQIRQQIKNKTNKQTKKSVFFAYSLPCYSLQAFFPTTQVEQSCVISHPKKIKNDGQKTVNLALCLQPPA